jgi:hypothetical protein
MKFLLVSLPDEKAARTPPSPEFLAEMTKFIQAEMKSGVLLATGGLLPISQGGARVRSSGGKFTVVDGPYTESKELIAGFAIVQVKSREEAIEASRRFYKIGGDGEGTIQQILEPGDFGSP